MKKDIFETINISTLKLLVPQSFTKLCRTIVEEAKKLVGAEYGTLSLLKGEKLERVYASSQQLKKLLQQEQSVKKRTIFILHGKEVGLGIKWIIIIPLSYKSSTIGVLSLYAKTDGYFTTEQIQILKQYASLVSLILLKTNQYDKIAKALEIRDRFINLASHELRNPLTAINGYIQLLYKKGKDTNTKESRWVKELYKESNRFTNLVKDLLDGKKIQS